MQRADVAGEEARSADLTHYHLHYLPNIFFKLTHFKHMKRFLKKGSFISLGNYNRKPISVAANRRGLQNKHSGKKVLS